MLRTYLANGKVSISSNDLAQLVGLNQSSISRFRLGKRMPGAESWFAICAAIQAEKVDPGLQVAKEILESKDPQRVKEYLHELIPIR